VEMKIILMPAKIMWSSLYFLFQCSRPYSEKETNRLGRPFLFFMNAALLRSATITFLDQLITKSRLTILCQLNSIVCGSFA